MEEFDANKVEMETIESKLQGIRTVSVGIRDIGYGLERIADGLLRIFVSQLEGERIRTVEKQDSLDHEYAVRDLLQATEQVQMMEAQLSYFQESYSHLPDGVREIAGFMVAMFDRLLHAARKRQRMAQEALEDPDDAGFRGPGSASPAEAEE